MTSLCFEGKIAIRKELLNLDVTLLGGQSFRWKKSSKPLEWRGVAYDSFWILTQSPEAVFYKVFPADTKGNLNKKANYFQNLIEKYFRLNFDLEYHKEKWKEAHEHFSQIASKMKAVRLLNQEPLENILSFICSQNNHIPRISSMVNQLCSMYGKKIGSFQGKEEYTFPSLQVLIDNNEQLESRLRAEKFGYRSKFIAQTVVAIHNSGGDDWFTMLQKLPYEEARQTLANLPGIGLKIADCVCLMSLNHLQSVPVDTHILKIARTIYMPDLPKTKSITPKLYNDISFHFQRVYGQYAGWAQAVLFCSELSQFKENDESSPPKKIKRHQQ